MAAKRKAGRPWAGASASLPAAIPTMITPEEMSYLRWLTGELWDGAGDVVEIGPWLGGSTWLLASGMEANPRREEGSRLHVIDNFRWRPFMAERADLALDADASFRPHFERNLAPKGDLIVIHEAALPDDESAALADPGGVRTAGPDLPLFSGDSLPGGVAIAFVDGAKSWMALRHVLRELAPRFLPGETVLVFQDFQHWLAYWVPMMLALWLRTDPGSLELVHTLSFNTVSFRVTRPASTDVLESFPPSIDGVATTDGEELLREAALMLERHGGADAAAVVELSRTAFLGTRGAWDEAVAAFREAEAGWPLHGAAVNQLAQARAWVAAGSGTSVEPSPRARRIAGWARVRSAAARRAARLARALRGGRRGGAA